MKYKVHTKTQYVVSCSWDEVQSFTNEADAIRLAAKLNNAYALGVKEAPKPENAHLAVED